MATCFVIQPFDGGKFDKRFRDVFDPAVQAAGLEPYRVDHDLGTEIPIDQIEAGIRTASLCLAEISTDNPNVWFELGFAIAARKPVVLVCSEEREGHFPFDVQHRAIIRYRTDSISDFEALKGQIEKRVKAVLEKNEGLESAHLMSTIEPTQGLKGHEVAALVAIAANLEQSADGVSGWSLRQDMERAGFTAIATRLAIAALLKAELVEVGTEENQDGGHYNVYWVNSRGLDWLQANHNLLSLQRPPRKGRFGSPPDDEIPF